MLQLPVKQERELDPKEMKGCQQFSLFLTFCLLPQLPVYEGVKKNKKKNKMNVILLFKGFFFSLPLSL